MSFFGKLWARITGVSHKEDDAPGAAPNDAAPPPPVGGQPRETSEGLAHAGTMELDERGRRRWNASLDIALEADARSLMESGDHGGAAGFLLSNGMALADHDEGGGLPCLCRRCIVPEVHTAERYGVTFERDFVVAGRRVLFFWVPSELRGEAVKVRHSVRSALRSRLHEMLLERRKQRRRERGPTINPFTGEPIK